MDKLENIVRRRVIWAAIIIFALVISANWIGEYVLLVPLVIYFAPLGIYSLLFPLLYGNSIYFAPLREAFIKGIHISAIVGNLIFWTIYIYFLINIKKMTKRRLYTLALIILLIIIVTLVSCSRLDYGAIFST